MTMMMMAKFILLANVLSNAPAARDRMVRGAAAEAQRHLGAQVSASVELSTNLVAAIMSWNLPALVGTPCGHTVSTLLTS